MIRVLAVVAFLLCSLWGLADTISLRADPWYPYNGEPGADKPGYMIEIARRIFEKRGVEVDYQLMNWELSLQQARKGRVDCVVGAFRTDAPDFLYPGNSLGEDVVGFFAARDNTDLAQWRYKDIKSLYNKRIGVVAAYSYSEAIDRFVADNADNHWVHTARGYNPLERNIRMLLAGRLDLLIESSVVMKARLLQTGFSDAVVELDQLPKKGKLYIACSPQVDQARDYIRMLDQGIVQLRQSGELDNILARYGLTDWQH